MNFLQRLAQPINDITTTPDQPPEFDRVLAFHGGRQLPYLKQFATRQKELYPDLQAYQSKRDPQSLFSLVCEQAKKRELWSVIHLDQARLRLELVSQTPWLKFKDDVVMEVRPEKGGSSLHMRSRSRLGRNDFGVNYRRISDFFASLDVEG